MNFTKIASLVSKDAPLLASIIGTASPIAGIIVTILMNVFGVKDEASLTSTIKSDPNASIKIKAIEDQHIDNLTALSDNDKASAREREESIVKSTGKRDWVLDLIAVTFIVFFFSICVLNFFFSIKDDTVMVMLIGQISAGVGMIISYYFGSCTSSNK